MNPNLDELRGLLERAKILAALPDGLCPENMGCNVANICSCCAIEDRAELIREMIPFLTLAEAGMGAGWRPIEEAPRDGTRILALIGDVDDTRWRHISGRIFEARHEGKTDSGYDLGWSLFPGFGGVGDNWFVAWQPLPSPPATKEQGDG